MRRNSCSEQTKQLTKLRKVLTEALPTSVVEMGMISVAHYGCFYCAGNCLWMCDPGHRFSYGGVYGITK
jgi:hypothetical protein